MTCTSRLLGLAALLLGAACSQREAPAAPARYSLIVVNIDSLRADHLGTYGYTRNTSPFIDSLARQGVVFERALANSSFTRESVATLFSGRLPSHGGGSGWNARPAPDAPTLARLLRAAGYATGLFSNTTMLTDPAFTAGFDEVEHSSTWGVSRAGARLSARAVEFLRRHPDRPFMLYLHYLDPHGPYDPPDDLYRAFVPHPAATSLDVYRDVRPRCVELVREGFGPGESRFEDMVARYDAEIADTDRAVALLFAGLDELGRRDRTMVVVTADHGEEFLEHGFVEHAWTLYDESLRVPLVLWAPGALPPERVPGLVSTVDITPTLLRLLEIPHRPSEFDGSALVEPTADGYRFAAPAHPYIGELLIAGRNVLRMIVSGEWKYIAAQRWLAPVARPAAVAHQDRPSPDGERRPFDLWGPVVHEELYDLAADPREQRNLVSTAPAKLDELRAFLAAYRARAQAAGADSTGNFPASQDLSPADRERLRSLGYVE